MNYLERLTDAVDSLFGKLITADEVAELCRSEGAQGYRKLANCCPLAKLVASKVNFYVSFNVPGRFYITEWDKTFFEMMSITAPKVCDDFAIAFDDGKYQDLVAWGPK